MPTHPFFRLRRSLKIIPGLGAYCRQKRSCAGRGYSVAATLSIWNTYLVAGLLLTSGCDSGRQVPQEALSANTQTAASQSQPDTATAESESAGQSTSQWLPLDADYLHDPDNPALALLQQPVEALSDLPRAAEGNYVDWVDALRSGLINPRTNILPESKVTVLDLDVLFEETAGQPMVLFPHRPHTEWLDCSNCHDKPFIPKKGANPVNMFAILQGEYCGQCHGAVSFPLTACARCHSVPRTVVQQQGPS